MRTSQSETLTSTLVHPRFYIDFYRRPVFSLSLSIYLSICSPLSLRFWRWYGYCYRCCIVTATLLVAVAYHGIIVCHSHMHVYRTLISLLVTTLHSLVLFYSFLVIIATDSLFIAVRVCVCVACHFCLIVTFTSVLPALKKITIDSSPSHAHTPSYKHIYYTDIHNNGAVLSSFAPTLRIDSPPRSVCYRTAYCHYHFHPSSTALASGFLTADLNGFLRALQPYEYQLYYCFLLVQAIIVPHTYYTCYNFYYRHFDLYQRTCTHHYLSHLLDQTLSALFSLYPHHFTETFA
ncbi:hypothetical protein BDF19DRAFT_235156 [Syncephalis fuscata]|nr:hypothetical protein BDF19DRAFT_235156 [Syncephalis fuscata]